MPRTGGKSSPQFSIKLDNPNSSYVPGEMVRGFVILNCFGCCPVGCVRLSLFGRAKTKISRKRSQTTAIHRGSAVFFDFDLVRYSGATERKWIGEQAWPFAIEIPTCPQYTMASGDRWKPELGYLSTDGDFEKHKLPGTFYHYAESGVTKVEAYVEYVLTATASEGVSSSALFTAIIPLRIRNRSTELPLSDHKCSSRNFPSTIRTLRFLPEHATEPLTFKQNVKSFLQPSSLPQYVFRVKVDYPTVVQLDHPKAIPFRLSVHSEFGTAKTTIAGHEDNTQKLPLVMLQSLSLYLHSMIHVRSPTTFNKPRSEKDFKYRFIGLDLQEPLVVPIILPEPVRPKPVEEVLKPSPDIVLTPPTGIVLTPPPEIGLPQHLSEHTIWSNEITDSLQSREEVIWGPNPHHMPPDMARVTSSTYNIRRKPVPNHGSKLDLNGNHSAPAVDAAPCIPDYPPNKPLDIGHLFNLRLFMTMRPLANTKARSSVHSGLPSPPTTSTSRTSGDGS